MQGRTCFVTGSTSGIGFETAKGLAQAGATVVVHGPAADPLKTAIETIRRQTGNPAISGLVADFSSLDEVRRMASDFKASHDTLHVLVNNAGTTEIRRRRTREGFEWNFGVNHLAPFLLTNLLLDRIRASAPARIVVVSSLAHRAYPVDLDDLGFERRRFSGLAAYGRSKFANILFAMECAKRLMGTGVTVNALHPGLVATHMGAEMPLPQRIALNLLRPFMVSAEQGARTSIHLATSSEVEGVTGRYFGSRGEATAHPLAKDPALAQALWQRSVEMIGAEKSRIS